MGSPEVASPYIGLVPYTEEDARFFFGRERDQRVVVANLFASHLTLLYGASGVGKSSLLRAGVIKELRDRTRRRQEFGEPPDLVVVYFNHWQGQLRARLCDAFRDAFTGIVDGAALEQAIDRPTVSEVVSALGERYDGDLFIILDQFEEFFLYHEHDATTGAFAVDLAQLASRSGPVSLLLSLRDDALSKLDQFKALIPNLFANYLRVRHLTPDEAREAICKPLDAYNALPDDQKRWPGQYSAQPEVVEAVIDEVRAGRVTIGDIGKGQVTTNASESIETPYLQLVMKELWRHETDNNRSHTLRRSTLIELGGAASIVRNHLNAAMNGLEEDERQVCASLFQFLVTPSGTKIAHSAADLAGFAHRPLDQIELVLSRLSGSGMRILSPVAPPSDRPGPIRYEIYHDSLAQAILEWRRRFVGEQERTELERETARQRAELEQAQALAEANRALAVAEGQRAAEQRRASKRLKVLAGALAVATIAVAVLAFQAVREQRRAEALVLQVRDQQQLRAENLELQAKKADSEQERERLLAQAEEYRKQAQQLTTQTQQTQTQPTPPKTSQGQPGVGLQAQLNEAMTRISSLETTNATLVQERDAAQKRLKEAQVEIDRLMSEVGRLQSRPQAQTPQPPVASDPFRIPEAYLRAHEEIRHMLEDYELALTLANKDQLAKVYPGYDAKELATLQQFARHIVTVTVGGMTFDSQNEATVSCEETRTLGTTPDSKLASETARVAFKLKKGNDGWQIVSANKE